jgi:hypothetical protein
LATKILSAGIGELESETTMGRKKTLEMPGIKKASRITGDKLIGKLVARIKSSKMAL